MMLHSNPLLSLNVARKKLELAGRSFTGCDIDAIVDFFDVTRGYITLVLHWW